MNKQKARHFHIKTSFVLENKRFVELLLTFPDFERKGQTLIDVLLKDGTMVKKVLVIEENILCIMRGMKVFHERDIADIFCSAAQ